jgi:hypothetical protein
MSGDPFVNAFTSEGFGAAYRRALKPPTREERLAAFEAAGANNSAAKDAAVNTVLGITPPAASTDAAVGDPAKPSDSARAYFRQLIDQQASSPEERAALEDALLDAQLDHGEIAPHAGVDENEFYVDAYGVSWVVDDETEEWVRAE